jgi:Lrp/AsnC family leucine-responsive transcriptional regulator
LREIQKDARISLVELSRRVNLTKTPCAERLKRLEAEGIITGYFAGINAKAVDAAHVVMVQVQLQATTAAQLEAFNDAVRREPQIQSCHMVAGGFDYLLKTRMADMQAYRHFAGTVLWQLPGVRETRTYAVMEEVKSTTRLALGV